MTQTTQTTSPRPPAWPAPFLRTIRERDDARDVAVALEQELARVEPIARDLARDLADMHDATAIDLDRWPTAKALVQWANDQHHEDLDRIPLAISDTGEPEPAP